MKSNKNHFTQGYLTLLLLFLCTTFIISCSADDEPEFEEEGETPTESIPLEEQIELLVSATAKYVNVQEAIDDGFVQQGPYVPNKGQHYMNMSRFDGSFDVEKPEILLYVPDGNGGMEFVAVEYAISLPSSRPEGFTGNEDIWAQNMNIGANGAWSLHAWVGLENPNGLFTAANPSVPASAPTSN